MEKQNRKPQVSQNKKTAGIKEGQMGSKQSNDAEGTEKVKKKKKDQTEVVHNTGHQNRTDHILILTAWH